MLVSKGKRRHVKGKSLEDRVESRFRGYIFQALTFSFGIYLGMFFSYVVQQVLNAHNASVTLTEYSSVYGLRDETFDFVIRECSLLSSIVLILSVLGIIALVVLLFALRQSTRVLTKHDKPTLLIMAISIFVWLIAPMAVISMTIQNPLLYITVTADVPESVLALLSQNYRILDQYRYFGKAFTYEMKVLMLVLTLYALSLYVSQRKLHPGKTPRRIYASIIAIPIVTYVLLEKLFPITTGITYTVGKVGLAFGGTGVIGGEVVIEPFLSMNQVSILISVILFIFVLVQSYKREHLPRTTKSNQRK